MRHRTLLTIALTLCTTCLAAAANPTRVSVADFGATPNDNRDDTRALRKAAAYCRNHPGTTLFFPPGIYRLRDAEAERLEQEVRSGKMGNDPEKVIFKPYYPYVRGLDFTGSDSVTIEARGATLMCEGWMEPLSIDRCRRFTVIGLTIDYLRRPLSEGIIRQVNDDSFIVQFGPECEITDQTPITRITIWDNEINGVYRDAFYFPARKQLGNHCVEIQCPLPKRLEGATLAALHSFHFRPAILIQDSQQTTLRDVTIHSQPGMGIVGFNSTDILLSHLSVCPPDGYRFSTNTDATHFACCRGLIRFDGCYFNGQGDDATNVHGYYHNIKQVTEGNRAVLKLEAPTFTHAQVTDVPSVGDTLELVRISTLVPERTFVVTEVSHSAPETEVTVRLDAPLPTDFGEYYLFNISKLPRLVFERCVVWGNMARGLLAKTRGVRVTDNFFRGCTGTAIHVGAESWWKEGTHAKDVLIARNTIVQCGLSSGRQFGAAGIAVCIDAPDTEATHLHENIRIEENTIIGSPECEYGIAVRNTSQVSIIDNRVTGCQQAVSLHAAEGVTLR